MPSQAVAEFLGRLDAVIAQGQLPAAERMVDEMLVRHPGEDELLYRKFRLQVAQRKIDQAFVTSLSFSSDMKANPRVNFEILMTIPRLQNIPVNDAVEAELCRVLEIKDLDCYPMWRVIYTVFQRRLAESRAEDGFLEALSRNVLFNATLRHFPLWDRSLESECIAIRRQLLELAATDPRRAGACGRLMLSMATQCFQNEYVFYVEPDERRAVERLRAAFDASRAAGEALDDDAQYHVLVLLMYLSPDELLGESPLPPSALAALDPEVAGFVEARLDERRLIQRYTAEFLDEATAARDATARVAELYDANPYPRWTKRPLNVNVQAREYEDLLGLNRCPAWDDRKAGGYKTMLVAGCGTGKHPTANAVMFPWLSITAVDISASCLAYARMMAERLNLNGMSFRLADIMALGDWSERFDIIECMGVLHHLEDPEAGLGKLVDLLVPGGVMKLGYYSEAARQNITRLRRERPSQGVASDRDYVRALRHRLFTDPDYRQYADILELGDFYTTSGASNVLLHEQEAQYTIPRLQQVLDDHGLRFLSVIEEDKPRFEAAGGKGSPFELMNWHPLEEKDPKFFAGMYEFYCQKKA